MGLVSVDREPKTNGYMRGQLWNRPVGSASYLVLYLPSYAEESEDPRIYEWDETGRQSIASYRSVGNLVFGNNVNNMHGAPELKAWAVDNQIPRLGYIRSSLKPIEWEPLDIEWEVINLPPAATDFGGYYCDSWLWVDISKIKTSIALIDRTSSDLIALPSIAGSSHNYYGSIYNTGGRGFTAYYSKKRPSLPDDENIRFVGSGIGAYSYTYEQYTPPFYRSASWDGFKSALLQVQLSDPLTSYFIAQEPEYYNGELYGGSPGFIGAGSFQQYAGSYSMASPDDENDITYYP